MTEPKRLQRSRSDRKIAGVLGGIATYFNVDSVAVRVLFILAAVFTGGCALLAYPFMWIVMPEEPAPSAPWPTNAAPAA
jgi:phage shock protein C